MVFECEEFEFETNKACQNLTAMSTHSLLIQDCDFTEQHVEYDIIPLRLS